MRLLPEEKLCDEILEPRLPAGLSVVFQVYEVPTTVANPHLGQLRREVYSETHLCGILARSTSGQALCKIYFMARQRSIVRQPSHFVIV